VAGYSALAKQASKVVEVFTYIFCSAIDWSGIHTALITCTFIALESTETTLYKGNLRIVGCVIGGALLHRFSHATYGNDSEISTTGR
jgi:multidrug resistance protein MdtO